MVASRSRRSRKTGISIPSLADVQGRIDIPENEYLVKVVEVTTEEGEKAPYLSWQFEVAEGKAEGGNLYLNTSLSAKALWNLKTLLEALGVEIPDDEFEIEPDDMTGLELMVSVEHETFEGKKRPKIVDFWPVEDAEPEPKRGRGKRDKEEPEERPTRGTKSSRKSPARGKKEPDPVTQDDINGMDQDELEKFCEDNELEVDFAKLKTLRKMKAAVIDAAEEAKLLDE